MARGITLTRSEQSVVELPDGAQGFRIVITASEAVEIDEEVFLFRKAVVNASTQQEDDDFLGVCSPLDLTTFPAEAPDLDMSPAFFRLSVIDLVVVNQAAAEALWDSVFDRTTELMDLLDRMDELTPVLEVRVGADL